MTIDHPLTPLLAPRSIAFVGASARPDTPGNDMMRMVRRGGFAGRVMAVNPTAREVEGYPCVPRLADLDAPPDLAVLAVRNDRLEAAMAEAAAAGARAAVIFASAHLPGDGDPPLPARLAAIARASGMPVCGSNCMGFYNDLDGVWVCGFPSPRRPQRGAIALVAHSGSVFGALAHNDPRLAFALAVSPGQEIATTVADYLDYAVSRPEVKVVGLFLETARDPAGLRRALEKAAARGVPVVALKVGRTDAAAAAALSHSGAVAGSDAAWDALFDHAGVIRVATIDELAATLMLLATGRRAAPGGLATIHDSGGEREMLIDLAERMGVAFAPLGEATRAEIARHLDPGLEPGNPLDAWGTGHGFAAQFEACLAALMADEATGLGLFCADIRDGYYVSDGFAAAARAVAARSGKPLAVATNYTQVRHDGIAQALARDGVPVLDGTTNALTAVRAALAYRDFLARPPDPPPVVSVPDAARRRERLGAGGPLDEAAALDLLAAWGLPVAAHAVADTAAAAVAAAVRVGFPVALKTAAPGMLHKSDVGGVVLGLADADAVAGAYAAMAARLGPRVTVAAMAEAGVELALGMVLDPQFGAVVVVGAGGTLIELLPDRVTALAPFGPATARRLIDRLALRPLLDGPRGRPPVDMAALAGIVARFSVLAADCAGPVAEIDVNPLVCARRIVAVDALVVPTRRGP
ncbi:MAG: acetate--CoA ligase family protein [Alphaproteobacteria bacterium]|nr:acetate--CoA ligase family protein [Alphaproteobacteria bacterium]